MESKTKKIKTLIPLLLKTGLSTIHITITETTHPLVIHSKVGCIWKVCQKKTKTLIPLVLKTGISTIHISITDTTHFLVIHSKVRCTSKARQKKENNINSTCAENRDIYNTH